MSTVLTRLPLTTTSRRLPDPAAGVGEAPDKLHPTNARPASAPAIKSPEIGISILPKAYACGKLLRQGRRNPLVSATEYELASLAARPYGRPAISMRRAADA